MTVPPYGGFRLLKRPHERSQYYLFGFLGLSLLTNIVLLFQNPLRFISISKNFDLIQRGNIKHCILFNDTNKSPVCQESYNAITALYVVHSEICVLTIQGKQFLKMNDEVPALLVQDMA